MLKYIRQFHDFAIPYFSTWRAIKRTSIYIINNNVYYRNTYVIEF